MANKFDVVLYEKPLSEGLTKDDVDILIEQMSDEFFPIEIDSALVSVAMGFISADYANKNLNYDTSELESFVSSILNDMDKETPDGIYHFKGGTIRIMR